MITESLDPVVAQPADPIDSLDELRSRHSTMLQRQRAEHAAEQVSPGEILGFLEAASALGRLLVEADSRESAQGIMDYWTATLLSQAPQASEGSRPFSLQGFDPVAGEGIRSEAQAALISAKEAANKADALAEAVLPSKSESARRLTGTLSDAFETIRRILPASLKHLGRLEMAAAFNEHMLRRLLLRLVRLKEGSLDPYRVPLPVEDEIVRLPGTKQMLRALEEAGVIRMDGAGAGATSGSAWTLVHDSLFTEWKYLEGVLSRRKAFREMARGWDRAGRQRAALLNRGPQLDQALLYRDCNETEQDFIEASRNQNEVSRKYLLTAAAIGMVIMGLLAGGLLLSLLKLRQTNRELKWKMEELTEQRAETEARLNEAERNAKIADVRLDDLATQTENVGRYSAQLKQLKSELDSVPNLSPQAKAVLEDTSRISPAQQSADVLWGVQAEVFVARDETASVTKAQRFVKALQDAGIKLPAAEAQTRRWVPKTTTEVRYFYKDERHEQIAQRIGDILGRTGMRGSIEPKFIDDKTAPERFIQVAVSRTALE